MTNNETKLYFKILKSLSRDSFINKKYITHFLIQYVPTPKFKNKEEVKSYNDILLEFAEKIKSAGHIEYDSNNVGRHETKDGKICSGLQIYASITPNGFIFLNNYLDRKASKRVTFFQIIIAILTTIFIGLTALYAYLTYQHDIKKDGDILPKLKLM